MAQPWPWLPLPLQSGCCFRLGFGLGKCLRSGFGSCLGLSLAFRPGFSLRFFFAIPLHILLLLGLGLCLRIGCQLPLLIFGHWCLSGKFGKRIAEVG